MKKLSTILCILALLFGALGGVSPVKAAKTIGTKYTSVGQLSGKAFAIVNETAGKAIYHKEHQAHLAWGMMTITPRSL